MSADERTRIQPAYTPTEAGTQLSGIYELDERLGSGGMGEVWRGHNIQTGDLVAIKIVLPEFARDQTILSLFRKEASILNHLSHEAVVRYHVFTIDPTIGRPYLAMEFVDGDSLFDVMRTGPMSREDVRKLCHRLASGLGAVHQAGAIHRDLSPDNIILPGGIVERAKIIDFGIARSATVGGETLIGGRFAGKYNYVSPEQLGLYGGEVSERSDIYSLGLVLAAALHGKPLDMSGSQFEVIEKRRSVPDLSAIDDDLRVVLEAMLQPDPADRPSSMAEIAWMTRSDYQVERDESFHRIPTERPSVPSSQAPRTRTDPANEPPSSQLPFLPGAETGGGFVEHVHPVLPSKSRSPPVTAAQIAAKSTGMRRNFIIITAAALVTVTGFGAWFGGLLPPWSENREPPASTVSALTPEPSPPAIETAVVDADVAPPPLQTETASAEIESQTGSGSADQGQEPVADQDVAEVAFADPPPQPLTPTDTEPSETTPEGTQPAGGMNTAEQILESLIKQARESAGSSSPGPEQDADGKGGEPVVETSLSDQPLAELGDEPSGTSPPPQTSMLGTEPTDGSGEPDAAARIDATEYLPDISHTVEENDDPRPPPFADMVDEAKDPTPEGELAPDGVPGASAMAQSAADAPQPVEDAGEPESATLAFNVPKPEIPPAKGMIAQRVAWLRDFQGGECFFAAPISVTENAVRVEGFATSVDPFETMLESFENRFGLEPDFEVRLIDAAQCAVPRFMRDVPASSARAPELVVNQMSIPSGGTLSGTLRTASAMRTSLLLIDHAGMVFSLDPALVSEGDKATFSVPITLDAGDYIAGKSLPELLIAISGERDLRAAAISEPTPASALLPRILSEIRNAGTEFSVTTKYFEIGG